MLLCIETGPLLAEYASAVNDSTDSLVIPLNNPLPPLTRAVPREPGPLVITLK